MSSKIVGTREREAIIQLPGSKRYENFVKTVVDWGEVWGLYSEGWALASSGDGVVFPMWPADEYARICAIGDWSGYVPKSFSIEVLLEELLPKLTIDSVCSAIFVTPQSAGVVIENNLLRDDIESELEKY